VWCGWICHLGALQEFLFMGKFEILKGRRSQDILRYVRAGVLVFLIAQILITKTNIFVHYDPFKVAFNLFSANLLGYILLGVLLVSSLFINRPFCRTVCPIGIMLGWVSLIPGASVIGVKKDACAGCKQCAGACKIHAITRHNRVSQLVNQDCIGCGECLDACGQKGLGFHTAGKEFPNVVNLGKCNTKD
jgi:polyferredoxin